MSETVMSASASSRLGSIDGLRGLIMVIMALDHANFFLNKVHPAEFWGITLPNYPGVFEFATRFITHLCAPGFFLTMGVGMAYWYDRHAQDFAFAGVIRHFGVRALLILLLHQLVENPAWVLAILTAQVPIDTYSPGVMPGGGADPLTAFGVLYSLSISMLFWAFCLRLKTATVLVVSAVVIVVSHYMIPKIDEVQEWFNILQRLLLVPGQSGPVIVTYPVLPWLGICGLGIALGRGLIVNQSRLFKLIPLLSVACIAAFATARSLGIWSHHEFGSGDGWQAFLNLTKYPPSINFFLLMVGLNLFLLYLLREWAGSTGRVIDVLKVFGRTPLVFYLAHLWLLSLLGLFFRAGASYWVTYGGWMLVVSLLYPVCRRYARFRDDKPGNSLWRAI